MFFGTRVALKLCMRISWDQPAVALQRLMAAVLLLGAACAIDDGGSGSELVANMTASGGAGADAGQATDAADAAADSTLSPTASMMYHRVGVTDPTTLELKGDGTFRWVRNGCDYQHADRGRWIDEAGSVVLLPRAGRAGFRWPDLDLPPEATVEDRISPLARLVLRRNGASLDAVLDVDGSPQVHSSWDPGSRCPQCGGGPPGSLGSTGVRECDDPFVGVIWVESLGPP
jgi:hypothetical protein